MRRAEPLWKRALQVVIGVPVLIVFAPLILFVVVGVGVHRAIWGPWLKWRFRRTWGKQGKVAVVVYSDSPHWKSYVEEVLLPPVHERVVTVNWSLRSQWAGWPPLEAQMVQFWGGRREYNPMAIIVPPVGQVRLIRFWVAFKDFQHGRASDLDRLCQEFQGAVRAA